jgi:WD40 repeat protein
MVPITLRGPLVTPVPEHTFTAPSCGNPGWLTLKVWDLGNPGKEPLLIGTGGTRPGHLTFSPNGSRLAAVIQMTLPKLASVRPAPPPLGAPGGRVQYDFRISIWDTATGQVRGETTMTADSVGSMAFSPDGTRLALMEQYDNGENLGRNIYLWGTAADDKLNLL